MTSPCFTFTSMADIICQTAPLLLPVTWQQHVKGYWQVSSTSTGSNAMGRHDKIGGVIFGAALIALRTEPCRAYPKIVLMSEEKTTWLTNASESNILSSTVSETNGLQTIRFQYEAFYPSAEKYHFYRQGSNVQYGRNHKEVSPSSCK